MSDTRFSLEVLAERYLRRWLEQDTPQIPDTDFEDLLFRCTRYCSRLAAKYLDDFFAKVQEHEKSGLQGDRSSEDKKDRL